MPILKKFCKRCRNKCKWSFYTNNLGQTCSMQRRVWSHIQRKENKVQNNAKGKAIEQLPTTVACDNDYTKELKVRREKARSNFKSIKRALCNSDLCIKNETTQLNIERELLLTNKSRKL